VQRRNEVASSSWAHSKTKRTIGMCLVLQYQNVLEDRIQGGCLGFKEDVYRYMVWTNELEM
jgi:hypothetical protein